MKLNRCFLRDANASREKTTTTKKKNLICRCARDPQPKRNPTSIPKSKARAVVVGGGWAGFGAAWNLSKSGWQVTLVDASPAPGGLAGSADQGQIELGIKGLWYHYKNIRAILRELGLEEIYGDFAETGFYSPRGLEVASPIFSKQPIRLPAPLGPLAYTANRFQDLPFGDRLSAFPLTRALLEFDLSEETYAEYDAISFETLCKESKVSKKLYETFLKPILLALLFVPPRELSAAAALSVLNNYVLAHQPDFDVQWPKRSPTEVFVKWTEILKEKYEATILNSTRVSKVVFDDRKVLGVELDSGTTIGADAIVLAAGASALPLILESSGLDRCKGLCRVSELSCSAVTAVRFSLRKGSAALPLKFASNVFSGPRDNIAGTFYDVGSLQGKEAGKTFEVDTYNAGALMGSSELELESAAKEVLSLENPKFASIDIEGLRVAKVKNAALRWTPGSHGATPAMKPEGAPQGLYIAGDLVKNGPAEFPAHFGARGLSQEKALVTGLQAGVMATKDLNRSGHSYPLKSIAGPAQVEPDEPHIQAAKNCLRLLKNY